VAVATLASVAGFDVIEVELESARHDADRIVVDVEQRFGQALFGFVRRQGLTDDQARDAVQETLLRLWRELAAGNSMDNPRAWSYRTIYRLAMDQHRLIRRIRLLSARLDPAGRSRQDPLEGMNDRLTVWAEVDRLPMRQRQVLYLRYRSDLSFDEIGEVLGMTASAGRSHATQALATLRRRLGNEGSI
jgi:RNA polymerase sigma factor (sigma-70 family)